MLRGQRLKPKQIVTLLRQFLQHKSSKNAHPVSRFICKVIYDFIISPSSPNMLVNQIYFRPRY